METMSIRPGGQSRAPAPSMPTSRVSSPGSTNLAGQTQLQSYLPPSGLLPLKINHRAGNNADGCFQMTCPQCKEPYRLQQNVSALYKLACYYNNRINKIVPFIAGLGFVSGAYCALTVHGWYALCTFCGEDLALRLFSDENWARPSYVIRMLFGLQFIPIWLLASRMRYFDSVLPFIPLLFIEQDHVSIYPHPRLSLTSATPRYETLPPGLTICVLPWLRIVYNKLWDRFVSPYVKEWEGRSQLGGDNNIIVRFNDENAQGNNHNNNNNNGGNNNNNNNAVAAVVQAFRQEAQARPAGAVAEADEVVLATSLTAVCRKVVGAMLLPDVCSLCGFLLGQIPWVKRKIPDRFSRNVLGGLVFLVLKVQYSPVL